MYTIRSYLKYVMSEVPKCVSFPIVKMYALEPIASCNKLTARDCSFGIIISSIIIIKDCNIFVDCRLYLSISEPFYDHPMGDHACHAFVKKRDASLATLEIVGEI